MKKNKNAVSSAWNTVLEREILILTTFTLYFQTVTVVGRHFFAKMISPEYLFSLLPTGFFIFLFNSNVRMCVISWFITSCLWWTTSPTEHREVVYITSCLIILNSKWKRKWTRRFLVRISLKTTKVEKKVLPTISITLSTRNRVYILCGSRTLREIYSRFIFSKRYKTILTFPFLSLIFLLKMGISNKNQNTKEEISIRFVIV